MIHNLKELESMVNSCIIKAMTETREVLFDVISSKVTDYYQEIDPMSYERTGRLMESLTASNILLVDGKYYFTVGWDDDYLTFQYPGNPSWSGNIPATGDDVLYYFNNKSHGGTVPGSHRYWDEAMEEINSRYGSVLELFKIKLKETGLPIR